MDGEVKVGGKFIVGKRIGSGAFGEVFQGKNNKTNQDVAIKIEPADGHSQLLYESKVYRYLQGGIGIPYVFWCGQERDCNIMAMELLGPSLEDLFNFCKKQLSLKTVLMIGDQILTRIEFMHKQFFLHRDIKPDNFAVGLNTNCNLIYMLDFGLAKRYRDPKTGIHIPYKDHKNLTGTARYASVNTHLGIEQSRRDDLEGLGYVLVYFLKGSLPWQGVKGENKKQRYEKIMEIKLSTSIEKLCWNLPDEFCQYFRYSKSLRFEDKPDYSNLRRMFKDLFYRNNYDKEVIFDWTILHMEYKRSKNEKKKLRSKEREKLEKIDEEVEQEQKKFKKEAEEKNKAVNEKRPHKNVSKNTDSMMEEIKVPSDKKKEEGNEGEKQNMEKEKEKDKDKDNDKDKDKKGKVLTVDGSIPSEKAYNINVPQSQTFIQSKRIGSSINVARYSSPKKYGEMFDRIFPSHKN